MQKQWFVVHTLSGQEYKVRENMQKRMQIEEMEDYIEEVLIPTEQVSEVKEGKKRETTRKFYPGYVLIKMALYDDDNNLNEKTWSFTQDTTGIIGFIGGDSPPPLRPEEVAQIMNQIEEKSDKITPKVDFEIGETLKINDGPFMNFNGEVEEIDPDHGRLKLMVSIFGRATPVDLEYWQVEKIV